MSPTITVSVSLLWRAFFKDHLTVKGRHEVSRCDSCACRREIVRLIGEATGKKGGGG